MRLSTRLVKARGSQSGILLFCQSLAHFAARPHGAFVPPMYMRIPFGSPNISFEHADHRSVCALA
jgi:hypothetical protein